jgi:hypothetical protein
MHDALFAFGIDDVVAQAAGCDERCVSRDVAGTLKEFAGRQSFEKKDRPNQIEVAGVERGPRFEIGAKDGEGRFHVGRKCYHPEPDRISATAQIFVHTPVNPAR